MVCDRKNDSPSFTITGGDEENGDSFVSTNWSDEPTDSVPVVVGYMPLGAEVVHTLSSESDDDDDDNDDNENVNGDQAPVPVLDRGNTASPSSSSSSAPTPEPVAACSRPDLDVDRLLMNQLHVTEFEPRGAFGDPSLYTDPLPDSTQTTLWNESAEEIASPDRIRMNKDKADEIRTCMANFALPSNHIPPWARTVPEETWTKQLCDKLRVKREHSNS